jgi:hypothetical protein
MLSGVALLVAGATARSAPAFLRKAPLPPEIVVPFVLWQLATWALLFGWFFLRPGRKPPRHGARAIPRV